MYIDEAQSLVSSPGKDLLFDLTQYAIDKITWTDGTNDYATHFFTLFLSTTSHAEDIAPPRSISSSARIRGDQTSWLAPHTVMPFDCHPELAKKL